MMFSLGSHNSLILVKVLRSHLWGGEVDTSVVTPNWWDKPTCNWVTMKKPWTPHWCQNVKMFDLNRCWNKYHHLENDARIYGVNQCFRLQKGEMISCVSAAGLGLYLSLEPLIMKKEVSLINYYQPILYIGDSHSPWSHAIFPIRFLAINQRLIPQFQTHPYIYIYNHCHPISIVDWISQYVSADRVISSLFRCWVLVSILKNIQVIVDHHPKYAWNTTRLKPPASITGCFHLYVEIFWNGDTPKWMVY